MATSRVEKSVEAMRLYQIYKNMGTVASMMGVSRSYASDLIRDPDGSLTKARKKRYAGVCMDCGGATDGSRGPNISPKRCAACNLKFLNTNKKWTRETLIDAIQRWAAVHGRPPKALEWLKSDPVNNYPAFGSVYNGTYFKKWSEAIQAAGFEPNGIGQYDRTGIAGLKPQSLGVLAFMNDHPERVYSPDSLRWGLDISTSYASIVMVILARRGLVEKVGRGKYQVTEYGRSVT